MPRSARVAPGGEVFHVINRAAMRFRMLRTDRDFLAFENLLAEALVKHPTRLLSYCLMGTHWHLVLWPREDGELSAFVKWLTHAHAMRWRVAHRTVGHGPLYQGRFRSFIVQRDESLQTVCRYVERNALTAGLVERAEDWRWSSLWIREHGTDEQREMLQRWLIDRPSDWLARVNAPLTAKEIERMQTSIKRDRPFGSEAWTRRKVETLGLESTVRTEGRPRSERPAEN